MAQTSKVVTVIDGIEVLEVTLHDLEGNPIETTYFVQGTKYRTLKEAREAARRIAAE